MQLFFVGINGDHIFRRGQDAPGDGLRQRDLIGDAPIEQLHGHVPLVVQIADVGSGQANQHSVRVHVQHPLHPKAPFLRPAAVELVQDDVIRLPPLHFQVGDIGQLGISSENHVLRLISISAVNVLALRLENCLAGRQPYEPFFRIPLRQPERDEGFPRSGWMNHCCLVGFGQQRKDGIVSRLTVGMEMDQ